MKILVVEDDFVSGKVIKKMMSSYGEVDIASYGEKGVELFEKALNEKNPYDVVCLDIMMPEMDGHEVLKRIRNLENQRGILEGTKVIITSALGDFNNIKAAYREQCEYYLVKPIEKEKLEEVLIKLGMI